MRNLPTPHFDKLDALKSNPELPGPDRPRLQDAISRYHKWIRDLQKVKKGQKGAVRTLVDVTNTYKTYFELNFIFDSPGNFLYRQKGQLKLDNTILEEFLPQFFSRALNLEDGTFEFGPQKTFSGLSFTSSLSNSGDGGLPSLRTKNQDFILGKRLYVKTSFDSAFRKAENVESHLGYVCVECKTNLDRTMFQEAVATSRDLKIAVLASLYFLVCEFLDMPPVSLTSTLIDDVLIVRKCQRMSANVRQEYKTVKARRKHRTEYAKFVKAAKFHPDVFQIMVDKIQKAVDETDPKLKNVLEKGHF